LVHITVAAAGALTGSLVTVPALAVFRDNALVTNGAGRTVTAPAVSGCLVSVQPVVVTGRWRSVAVRPSLLFSADAIPFAAIFPILFVDTLTGVILAVPVFGVGHNRGPVA